MSDKSGKQLTALRSELTRLGAERTAITQFKKLNAT
jgi:hypothetical protein